MTKQTISPRGVNPRIPIMQSITAKNVERAYCYDDQRQQLRIEEWGRINREALCERGAKVSEVTR